MGSLINYSEIPGYLEAVNREQTVRELAFLPVPLPICGVPIRHMNMRHYMLLQGCGNRFVCGGRPGPADVLGFLWFLSPEYSTQAGAREKFAKDYAKAWRSRFSELCGGIVEYLDGVFQDSPASDGTKSKSFTAAAAGMVDTLASQYGWRDEDILEMPIARIFQYYKRIEARLNPKKPQFNRSDAVISKWLRDRVAQN